MKQHINNFETFWNSFKLLETTYKQAWNNLKQLESTWNYLEYTWYKPETFLTDLKQHLNKIETELKQHLNKIETQSKEPWNIWKNFENTLLNLIILKIFQQDL